MDNRFWKHSIETDENGNLVVRGSYEIANELVHNMIEQKENLYKRFCMDVCKKMVSCYAENGVDVIRFHRIFNEKFNDTVKEWGEDARRKY